MLYDTEQPVCTNRICNERIVTLFAPYPLVNVYRHSKEQKLPFMSHYPYSITVCPHRIYPRHLPTPRFHPITPLPFQFAFPPQNSTIRPIPPPPHPYPYPPSPPSPLPHPTSPCSSILTPHPKSHTTSHPAIRSPYHLELPYVKDSITTLSPIPLFPFPLSPFPQPIFRSS